MSLCKAVGSRPCAHSGGGAGGQQHLCLGLYSGHEPQDS